MEKENNTTENKIENNNEMWGILAYILFAIPLIFAKEKTPFIKYHANQSFILLMCFLVGNFLLNILNFDYSVISTLFRILSIAIFVVGIVNVSQNKMKPLPIIGEWGNFIK